jgi:hypothetical protein
MSLKMAISLILAEITFMITAVNVAANSAQVYNASLIESLCLSAIDFKTT